jgi:endonuclease/exonuclease/phosphatase family metal-dependent hydrolase
MARQRTVAAWIWVGSLLTAALGPEAFAAPHAPQPAKTGVIQVLTYNVAGLPEGLSASRPVSNLPVIGARLNRYDLALIQEDYAYPALLRQRLTLPFVSPGFVPGDARHFGDGLSQFGKVPLAAPRRTPWRVCHGIVDSYFDCWTPKGIALTRAELAPGVSVDVYNVHLDAGGSAEDRAARESQLAQLIETIRENSDQRAAIIGGDFNLTRSERAKLQKLEDVLGARDVCAALGCPEPNRIDRILVRSSPELKLLPRSWRVDHGFRDPSGRPLSDHLAVAVQIAWQAR